MRESMLTEEQFIAIVREQKRAAPPPKSTAWNGDLSAAFYEWTVKFGCLDVSNASSNERLGQPPLSLISSHCA